MTDSTSIRLVRTIGLDLGSTKTAFCVQDSSGERIDEGVLPTKRRDLRPFFEQSPKSRVVLEASGPSRWVAELAEACGHEVVVSNPREFRLICESHRKSDRNDARILAEFGQFKPKLLRPIQLRGIRCQLARATISIRAQVVAQRTEIISLVRAQVRNLGEDLTGCTAANFHRTAPEKIPTQLRTTLEPLLELLQSCVEAIETYDREIERLCTHEFPETAVLRQVPGVGPNTALSYVATVEDPSRFPRSRDVGAYVGLVSRSRSSGASNPQLPISKRGDRSLRRLLVTAATYMTGPRGQDTDLRRFGERLMARGDQASRAKARIAVARKLAVLLHRLWVTGEVYEPLRNSEAAVA